MRIISINMLMAYTVSLLLIGISLILETKGKRGSKVFSLIGFYLNFAILSFVLTGGLTFFTGVFSLICSVYGSINLLNTCRLKYTSQQL